MSQTVQGARAVDIAAGLMSDFAERTGLTSDRLPHRYLWTDAFAVCNFLELHRHTRQSTFMDLARRLIDQVHEILGRHRVDDTRQGWLSGLDDEEARRHPTIAGLRIGKPLAERLPHEAYDARLEWDRDGQYYHYLTKWMLALQRMWRVSGEDRYFDWAVELAEVAHQKFLGPGTSGDRLLHWKMSIDLSRPVVNAMGQHDPLDGLITFEELATVIRREREQHRETLEESINELARMCESMSWETGDPLGAGGLLTDTYRVARLVDGRRGYLTRLLPRLLATTLSSVRSVAELHNWSQPAEHRLAFRELGFAIGLSAVDPLIHEVSTLTLEMSAIEDWLVLARRLQPYAIRKQQINELWLDRWNQQTRTWKEHEDINAVMLATSLLPATYLAIG